MMASGRRDLFNADAEKRPRLAMLPERHSRAPGRSVDRIADQAIIYPRRPHGRPTRHRRDSRECGGVVSILVSKPLRERRRAAGSRAMPCGKVAVE